MLIIRRVLVGIYGIPFMAVGSVLTRAGAVLRLLKPHAHPDQDCVRRWVADGHHVRMVLPWHGPASWDDMHEYVTAVITDNLVPNEGRAGWGGMTDQEQAERFARGILLSLCARLAIEPTGAFIPDPDEEDDPAPVRCPSCDHGADIHSHDGCWFTVAEGRPGKDSVCQCRLPREEITR